MKANHTNSIKNVLIRKTLQKQCLKYLEEKKIHDLLGSPKEYLDILWPKKEILRG